MGTTIMSNEVAIFKDTNGNIKVVPDYVFFKKQGVVKFFAVNTTVLIIISKLEIEVKEKPNAAAGQYIEIPAGKKMVVKLKNPGDDTNGEYPYAVFCPDTGEFLKGNSPPSMIIIDDP